MKIDKVYKKKTWLNNYQSTIIIKFGVTRGFKAYFFQKMFGSVVMVVFQNAFHSEKYQNNIFFIFKKLFLISAHQNDLKTIKKY